MVSQGPGQGTSATGCNTCTARHFGTMYLKKRRSFFVVVAAAIHLKLSHKLQTLSGREHLRSDLFLHSYLFLSYLVLFLYWCCKQTCLLVQFGHILYA